MESPILPVQPRDKEIKAKHLLKNDILPAVYYGKDIEPVSLQMDYQSFRRIFRDAGGNTIVMLDLGGKKLPVLIHEVSYHPVSDRFIHIDFVMVTMGEVITTEIPLEFTGTSNAVKDYSGTLVKHMNEIEVKCLPKDLVSNIEVDISVLEDFNSQITVADLNVPSTLEVLDDGEMLVAAVSAPRVEEENDEVEEVDESEGEETDTEGEDKNE